MRKRLLRIIFMVMVLFVFYSILPQKVSAGTDDGFIIYQYYFPVLDMAGEIVLTGQELDFYGKYTKEEIALVLFTNIFHNNIQEYMLMIPENTKLLGVDIKDGILTMNLSKEIKRISGTANENAFLKQIFTTAREIEGIEKITILIEGDEDYLNEGSFINRTDIGDY